MELLENLFKIIGAGIFDLLTGWGLPAVWAEVILVFIEWLGIVALVTVDVIILIWLERKISGFIQERLGPNRLGPIGVFQTIADTLKLLTKEDIVPRATDKIIFMTAPMFFIIVSVMLYLVLPLGDGMAIVDLDLGLFYFIAVSSLSTICLFMAGWGSNNKWSLMGAMRSVAQMVSYEIPLVFSLLGIIMIAGSLKLSDIIAAQDNIWFVFLQPLGFLIYIIAATAELNRGPFDMPEAEQELTAGAYTEYTGMRWALFFLAEYTNLAAVSVLAATLFFGGWSGPWLPSWIWVGIKAYVIMIVFMWFKWTLPRIRMDHLMAFSWKFLIPASLANVLLTGAGIHFFKWMGW